MTQDATDRFGFMFYSPAHFDHVIVLAATIILKILHSNFAVFVDFAEGKRVFNLAVSLLRRASIEDNDLSGRGSKILAQLWVLHSQLTPAIEQDQEPQVRLRTRLSASVMHDELWVWRDGFPRPSTPQASGSVPMPGESDCPDRNGIWKAPGRESLANPDCNFEGMDQIWDLGIPSLLPIQLDIDCQWDILGSDQGIFSTHTKQGIV